MKLIWKPFKRIKADFYRLTLVDRSLLIIMSLLFIQIALNLFGHHISGDINEIDIVIRTTAAAVFGYFLSSNFMKTISPREKCIQPEKAEKRHDKVSQQQIIIVSAIGIISIILLIIARNIMELTPEMQTTIAQLRDFVSGSVGFLVGSPPDNKIDEKK